MKSNRVRNEQKRLIDLLRRNPNRYSMQGLKGLIHICIVTIKKTIIENDLKDLLKKRKTNGKKKGSKGKSKFFEYNKLEDIY